jgi:hypothetical protein
MLIDRTHRGWAVATTLLLGVATVLYVGYARAWPGGPSGRTWPGMLFGVAGAALMLFAGLLAVRKRMVRVRIGSLSWWLRAHLWMGLLSVPLIFYHAAFRWGGTLEIILWITLAIVVVSGVIGLVLQNILPRVMKLQLLEEIIPDQLAQVCRRLALEADDLVVAQCKAEAVDAALRRSPDDIAASPADQAVWLAGFYVHTVRPFLEDVAPAGSPLANPQQAQLMFDRARSLLPYDYRAAVDSLEQSCAERRQLAEQARLYNLLHGWLKIHVPISIALLVFSIVHIVTALYY